MWSSALLCYLALQTSTCYNVRDINSMFRPLTIRAFNPTTGFQLLRSPKSGLIKEDLSHGSWWCHVDYPQIDTQTVLRAWASWLLNARSPTSLMQIANLARKQYTVENFLMNLSLMFVCCFGSPHRRMNECTCSDFLYALNKEEWRNILTIWACHRDKT